MPQNNNAPEDYVLCFKCHNEASLNGTASFKHRSHVINRGASCLACHDPHGSTVYPHMPNFQTSTSYVGVTLTITGVGIYADPTWIDDGVNKGTCWMTCHGSTHNGRTYKQALALKSRLAGCNIGAMVRNKHRNETLLFPAPVTGWAA